MTKKPYEPPSISSLTRRVKLIRKLMGIVQKSPATMENAVGTDTWFDTAEGSVRALTYGFDNPEVKPLIVNIHGSGFTIGSAAMDDPFMMRFVDNCNAKVISIDYSLAPEARFPIPLNQCYAVVKYAKEHADELAIDPDNIVIMGHSAGGNMCIGIGILDSKNRELGLKGIILDYPPTDIATDAYDKPLPKGCLPPALCRMFDASYRDSKDAKNPLVSPVFATKEMIENFPPVLLITAGQDTLSYEAEEFRDMLIDAGVDVSYTKFEGQKHGFTVQNPIKTKRNESAYEASEAAWCMMMDFAKERINAKSEKSEQVNRSNCCL